MFVRSMAPNVRLWLAAIIAFTLSLVTLSSAQSTRDLPKSSETRPAKPQPPVFSHQGLWLSNKDHSTFVRVHGYLQADGRLFVTDLKDAAYQRLLFRRVRPLVEGKLANLFDFRFMPDFGEGNAVVQEVYVENGSIPFVRLRAGKFKTPLGLEVLRSDRELTFAERSLASDLVPLRDLGIQARGSFWHDGLTYETGFFSGTGDGTNSKFQWRGTHEEVGRIFVKPFANSSASALNQLGLGLAASEGRNHGALPSFKSVGQQTFFKYSTQTMASGEHRRIAPQAYYFYGPLGMLAEYTVSRHNVSTIAQHRPLSNTAWEVAGSFALTGERNSYDGLHPAHSLNFWHGTHHWGALEAKVRHSEIAVDSHTFPQFAVPAKTAAGAHESAAGISWYLNRNVKILSDYEYTSFPGARPDATRLPTERVFMTRIQLAF